MASRQLTVVLAGDARAATRAFKETGDSAERESGRIGPAFASAGTALSTALGPGIGESLDSLGKFGPALDSIKDKSLGAGQKLAGVGVGVTGLGVALSTIGSGSKAADQQLEQAITNSGHTLDDFSGRIDKTVTSMAKFGYEDDEVKNSLQSLTEATGDPQKALDLMGTAADLAASKHISLHDASDKLAKLMNGKGTRELSGYGIALDGVGTKSEQGERAIGKLGDKLKGQASASADTFTGKLKGTKAELSNLAGDLGAQYGPAITAAGVATTGLGAGVELLKGPLSRAASGIASAGSSAVTAAGSLRASLGPAIASAVASGWAWITQLWAQAVAMVAAYWPILAIIAGVALLIAGIVLLAQHWDQVWGFIKRIAGDVWHWLEDNVIHPVAGAFDRFIVDPVRRALGTVGDIWTGMKNIVSGVWEDIKGFISRGVDVIVGIKDRISDAFSTVKDIMFAPFKAAFNLIVDAWNATIGGKGFSTPDWIPGIGGKNFRIPELHHFAAGTNFAPGGLALVGENGPELTFLPRGAGVATAPETNRLLRGGMGQSFTQNIEVHSTERVDPDELARSMAWQARVGAWVAS